MLKIFIISIFTFFTLRADIELELSDTNIANAQTLLVKFKADLLDPVIEKKYVAFEGKRYPFYKNPMQKGRSFYALIPVDYYAKAKKSELVIVYVVNGEKYYSAFKIEIYEKEYKKERLKVASSRVKFSKKDKKRIKKERIEAMKIYRKKSKRFYPKAPFIYPLDSKITSAFGTKRIFNDTLKSYHSGTDFRAKKGEPVKAVADGKVVLVKNRFFAGNSIIIDHGQGVYSGYYHLSKFKVKKGEFVKRGQVIALAGATGRVTGPHLHLSMRVNAVQVDPIDFIKTVNLLLYR